MPQCHAYELVWPNGKTHFVLSLGRAEGEKHFRCSAETMTSLRRMVSDRVLELQTAWGSIDQALFLLSEAELCCTSWNWSTQMSEMFLTLLLIEQLHLRVRSSRSWRGWSFQSATWTRLCWIPPKAQPPSYRKRSLVFFGDLWNGVISVAMVAFLLRCLEATGATAAAEERKKQEHQVHRIGKLCKRCCSAALRL